MKLAIRNLETRGAPAPAAAAADVNAKTCIGAGFYGWNSHTEIALC